MLHLQEIRSRFAGVSSETDDWNRAERRGRASPRVHLAGPGRLHPSEDARQASTHSTWRDSWGLRLQELLPSFGQRKRPTTTDNDYDCSNRGKTTTDDDDDDD